MRTLLKLLYTTVTAIVFVLPCTAQTKSVPFKLPAYEKFVLPNGLSVYLMEQHEVPVINVNIILPAGAIYDADKPGLASLTAGCLQHGTANFTKQALEEALDFTGASLNTYASKESAGLSAKFAAKDQDKIFAIIKEVLLTPTFNAEEFDKEKKRVLVGLEQAKESPRQVIGGYWDKFIYGDHVYGNNVNGNTTTVAKLMQTDVAAFYKANYIPNGSAIAVAGDFNAREMKVKLTSLFAGWKKSNEPHPNLAAKPISFPATARVLLVNKDDAHETTFYIGAKGVNRNNPDYVAIEVVNTVFGGRFTSWLNDKLRVNSGLTYGAGSRFSSLKNAGTFYISTFTATKTTAPTIEGALSVIDSLHKDGIDDKTLASAKNYVKGQYPPRYETAGQLANLLTTMFWYGFDESFINNFQNNVDGLTVEKAKEIVAKYFPKDNLQFVLIGKSADIKKIAEKYGPVTEMQIKEDSKPKGF